MSTTYKNSIKAAIKKQIKYTGSHIGSVVNMLAINFPTANFEEYKEFFQTELKKHYAK